MVFARFDSLPGHVGNHNKKDGKMKRIVIVVLLCLAALFAASAITKAKADTYVDRYGMAICKTFRDNGITMAMINKVGASLMSDGLSPHDAADTVVEGVSAYCPWYSDTLSTVVAVNAVKGKMSV